MVIIIRLTCRAVCKVPPWKDTLARMQTKMRELHAPGSFVGVVTREFAERSFTDSGGVANGQLWQTQKRIGWKNTIKGRLHKDWHQN